MQKDIIIPKVENVYVAAVQEWNDDFMENSWYAHLVNENDVKLEMAIVVSRAYGVINGEQRKTGVFRHAFKEIEPNSSVKIELLENNVLQLNNEFAITFFIGDKLYDKTYVFRENTINDRALTDVPVMNKKGVLVK